MENIIESIIQMNGNFSTRLKTKADVLPAGTVGETFSKMRRSQYMAWPEPLLESWKADLVRAGKRGATPHREIWLHDVHQ